MADGFVALAAKYGQPAPPPPDYDLTQIVTLEFSRAVRLEDKTTAEGQVWDQTIQTYLQASGTKAVWWGYVVSNHQIAKLIVDWTSSSERERFFASSDLSSLLHSWQSSDVHVVSSSPTWYKLAPPTAMRLNVFRPPQAFSEDCVTVLFNFHFSPSCDLEAEQPDARPPRSKRAVWEDAWSIFAHSALRSEGGIISSRGDAGWSADRRSWLGAFRFMNADLAHKFLSLAEEEMASSQQSGWGRLKSLADGGTKVELLSMISARTK